MGKTLPPSLAWTLRCTTHTHTHTHTHDACTHMAHTKLSLVMVWCLLLAQCHAWPPWQAASCHTPRQRRPACSQRPFPFLGRAVQKRKLAGWRRKAPCGPRMSRRARRCQRASLREGARGGAGHICACGAVCHVRLIIQHVHNMRHSTQLSEQPHWSAPLCSTCISTAQIILARKAHCV